MRTFQLIRRAASSIVPRFGVVHIHKNMSSSVIASDSSDKGFVILNRPQALNALNLEMVRKINKSLRKWEFSKLLVVVKGTGDKSFCAGGDVRALVEAGPTYESKSFFKEEYTMNSVIGNYKIPYIALIDGITMGGGVGLSVHGKYIVATERTLFAMPETAIGLFPDVGGSYFLPKLKNHLGMYLGLTGFRLRGEDVLKAGIATHFCESSQTLELEKALLDIKDADDVGDVLKSFHKVSDKDFVLKPHLDQITECFHAGSVEEIYSNLERDGSEWAQRTIKVSVNTFNRKLFLARNQFKVRIIHILFSI